MFTALQEITMNNDRLYKQMDGVTIGSSLGPTLFKIFWDISKNNNNR